MFWLINICVTGYGKAMPGMARRGMFQRPGRGQASRVSSHIVPVASIAQLRRPSLLIFWGGRPSGLWQASWGGSGQDGRRHGEFLLSLPETPGAGVEVSPVSSLGG